MSDLLLSGGRVLREGDWVEADLVCRDGVVVEGPAEATAERVDVSGMLVAPGLIDLQCNGALGIDVTRSPERVWELAAALPRWGVTAWLPTVVTAPLGAVDAARAAVAAGPPEGWRGAVPLGLHVEGPFLARTARGAHPEAQLRLPDAHEAAEWSPAGGVAVVTLAPELPGALQLIEALVDRGVVVSLGHSAATVEEAAAAVDAGARWVTHLFNGMPAFHHRQPGLAGVALTDERVRVGVIADGVHVHPTAVAVAQRALGDRLVLVTDGLSQMGQPATAAGTGVRLADGTLAGCDVPMDQALRNLASYTGRSPAQAVHAASGAPAAVLGDDRRGALAPGMRADLVVLTPDLYLRSTYVGGQLVHDARWSAPAAG